ncbi:hypothetical protein [Pengzhenrongella sp.]|jgi:hypothetical protein|uniref:hypothetical protein n=1 Tax=Pengzhenrongella sp. TaxID=2888820 RepID=UPI002F925691
MATELIVKIVDADADDDVLERSALLLREEIGALDVDSVQPLTGGEAPAGTRGFSVDALGALLVSLGPSARLLGGVVQAVRAWLSRGPRGRTVRLELGGDVLELTGASSQVQDRLVEEWIRQHATQDAAR